MREFSPGSLLPLQDLPLTHLNLDASSDVVEFIQKTSIGANLVHIQIWDSGYNFNALLYTAATSLHGVCIRVDDLSGEWEEAALDFAQNVNLQHIMIIVHWKDDEWLDGLHSLLSKVSPLKLREVSIIFAPNPDDTQDLDDLLARIVQDDCVRIDQLLSDSRHKSLEVVSLQLRFFHKDNPHHLENIPGAAQWETHLSPYFPRLWGNGILQTSITYAWDP
ncbi:uncharacterized protein FIBRA_08716 [Fibroporia radiculosa]|uniref:Uncharacterized protein n=1 Tax=Fibroporia radiculosa TaxID=599839 RepID=J4I380_9APHY|nr:uncharacterized protein FIBRA_08716 [Fibroporia radiculosa]CCM06452.1 predicted protein [Fibroporia radiculosa]